MFKLIEPYQALTKHLYSMINLLQVTVQFKEMYFIHSLSQCHYHIVTYSTTKHPDLLV